VQGILASNGAACVTHTDRQTDTHTHTLRTRNVHTLCLSRAFRLRATVAISSSPQRERDTDNHTSRTHCARESAYTHSRYTLSLSPVLPHPRQPRAATPARMGCVRMGEARGRGGAWLVPGILARRIVPRDTRAHAGRTQSRSRHARTRTHARTLRRSSCSHAPMTNMRVVDVLLKNMLYAMLRKDTAEFETTAILQPASPARRTPDANTHSMAIRQCASHAHHSGPHPMLPPSSLADLPWRFPHTRAAASGWLAIRRARTRGSVRARATREAPRRRRRR
jgi:hypothetical protein